MEDGDVGWLVLGVFLIAIGVVGGISNCLGPQPGEEWGECYPNQTCLEELVCHRERCVAPMEVE